MRLMAGWLFMLVGVLLMLDSGMPASRPRSRTWPAVQALGGFALVVAGSFLRRRAVRQERNPGEWMPR